MVKSNEYYGPSELNKLKLALKQIQVRLRNIAGKLGYGYGWEEVADAELKVMAAMSKL